MSQSKPMPQDGFTRRQQAILVLLLGAGFLMSADFSILNVAIPLIGEGVGLGVHQLAWIATAYALPAAGFALIFGRMADLFGRRRIFMLAMALLTASSMLGGLASSPSELLGARVLQGLSTAMALPASLSLLTTTFADGRMRARVLGLNGALLSGGFSFGALAGGGLVSLFGWRSAFLINVPVALAILVATPMLVARSRPTGRAQLDLPGAATLTLGLLATIFGILEHDVVITAVGLLILVAFCVIERLVAAPLVPVRILRRASVHWGNYAGFVIFTMETGMIFLMTLHLQRVVGLSPLVTGMVLGVPGLVSVVAGVIAGRLISRFDASRLLVCGMTVQALTTIPLLAVDSPVTTALVAVPCLFIGFFGHVTAIVAFTVTSTSGLAADEQGLATGLVSMTQQVAITVGAPTLSAIAATRAVESAGTHLALCVSVVVTLASAGVIWFGLSRAAQPQAPDRSPGQPLSVPV